MASYLNQPFLDQDDEDPSAVLDPHEITHSRSPPDHISSQTDPQAVINQTFRHSFWRTRRDATHRILKQLCYGTTRLARFESCGMNAWICQSDESPLGSESERTVAEIVSAKPVLASDAISSLTTWRPNSPALLSGF